MLYTRTRAFAVMNLLALGLILVRIWMAFVEPSYSFVDDLVYVGAAIHLDLGEICAAVGGNQCNYEHPPLAKLLMALGFEIFGRTQVIGANPGLAINQLGGRFFNIVMASLLAPVVYLIVVQLSGNLRMAFLAGVFVLVDPLLFTLSLTAGLDVAMVFFGTAAFLPYIYGAMLWKLNSYVLTGLVMGLSFLSKETAVFILLALLTYNLVFGSGTITSRIVSSVEIVVAAGAVFIVGLQLYDTLFTPFPTFLDQLELMVSFSVSVGGQQLAFLSNNDNCALYAGLCPSDHSLIPHFLYSGLPLAIIQSSACVACWNAVNPLDWLTYFPPVGFPTALVLAPNYPLVWIAYAWVPLVAWRARLGPLSGEMKAAVIGAMIFGWNVLSNLWVYVDLGRPFFGWYFLPAVPALAIGGAYLLTRPKLPKLAVVVLVAAIVGTGLFLSPVVYHILYPAAQYCTTC